MKFVKIGKQATFLVIVLDGLLRKKDKNEVAGI